MDSAVASKMSPALKAVRTKWKTVKGGEVMDY